MAVIYTRGEDGRFIAIPTLKGNPGEPGGKGDKGDPGKDGASVTVTNVSTSAADGGSNVVTFSDGKTLTVKNGSKGSPGADGKTPVKGTDYFTASEKAQMVSDVKASLPTLTLTGVDANGVTHTYTIYGS